MRASYLLPVWMGVGRFGVVDVVGFFFLGAAFLVLALIHGLSVCILCLSLFLTVSYLSSLAGHLRELAGWSWSFLGSMQQLAHFSLCGHAPSAVVSIWLPFSWASEHLWHPAGLGLWCSVLVWGPLHRWHVSSPLHWLVMWSRLQHLRHCDTGGLSWKALNEQCLPKAMRDRRLRKSLAFCSSSRANTRDDLGVVSSSLLVLSHLGLATKCLVSAV